MKDGFYRLHYKTATLATTGVVVLDGGYLFACDRYYFMQGEYRHRGNRIEGNVTFTRHTDRPGMLAIIPRTFNLALSGVSADQFGQFDVWCPAIPLIRGSATFTWLGELNATYHGFAD